MRPQRRVETGQEYLHAQRNGQNCLQFTCLLVEFAGAIHNKIGRKRICCGLRREHAQGEQERLELSRLGNSTSLLQSDGGCYDEVLTKEEATVYVTELDLLVTTMLLEDTLAVLSLGKLCEDHGFSYHWTSGQKTHNSSKKVDG